MHYGIFDAHRRAQLRATLGRAIDRYLEYIRLSGATGRMRNECSGDDAWICSSAEGIRSETTGVYFFLSWYATGLLATAMNN